jgi:hypothetical protein
MPKALEENLQEQYSANRRKIDYLFDRLQSVRRRMREFLELTQDLENASPFLQEVMKLQELGKSGCELVQNSMIRFQEQNSKIVKENPHIRFYY